MQAKTKVPVAGDSDSVKERGVVFECRRTFFPGGFPFVCEWCHWNKSYTLSLGDQWNRKKFLVPGMQFFFFFFFVRVQIECRRGAENSFDRSRVLLVFVYLVRQALTWHISP